MQGYNNRQNSFSENKYEREREFRNTKPHNSLNALRVTTIIISTVAIVISVVTLLLLAVERINNRTNTIETTTIREEKSQETYPGTVETAIEPEPMREVKTMYVNCDTTLSFRNGPGTEYPKIFDLSPGEAVIHMGQEENGFAKVNYDGTVGYVSVSYLSDVRPYVWWYNADEVEYFVEEVLYAYVNAINFDDVSVLTQHLRGKAVTDAINTHNMIRKSVYEEKILSVNCYGTERISKTRVNVIRESTIRVYKKDGTYRDAVEKYVTTVENTGDGMYVVGYSAVK